MDRTKVDNEVVRAGDQNALHCTVLLDGEDVTPLTFEAHQREGFILAGVRASANRWETDTSGITMRRVKRYGKVEVFVEGR